MTLSKFLHRATLGAALLACGSVASAALVTSRAALGGDDYIDWGQLALTDTNTLDPLTTPASVTSNLGATAQVQNTGGGLFRFNEGDGTFGGNFTTGDALLTTFFDSGNIDIDFGALTGRAGAQIQGVSGQAFRATIAAYGMGGGLLESWDLDGPEVSDPRGDGSNIFIGISRSANDIDRIVFSVSYPLNTQGDTALAINRLSFGQAPGDTGGGDPGNNVPEPATLALVMAALGMTGLSRRSQQSR